MDSNRLKPYNMKEVFKASICIFILALISLGAYSYQDIRVVFPLIWNDGSTSISIDTVSTGGVVTKGDLTNEFTGYEAVDKHFFRNNLTANTNHTHDANGFRTTINELGGWDMYLGTGVIAGSEIELDSGTILVQTLGPSNDINIISKDDLFLTGGYNANTISLYNDHLILYSSTGDIDIDGLGEEVNPEQFVGRASGGKLTYSQTSFNSFTPTGASSSNIGGDITFSEAFYYRIGNMVWVQGLITTDADAQETISYFYSDLPIASSLSAVEHAVGTGTCSEGPTNDIGVIQITGDPDNDRVKFQFYPYRSTDVHTWSYQYSYRIL